MKLAKNRAIKEDKKPLTNEDKEKVYINMKDALFYYKTSWGIDVANTYKLPEKTEASVKKKFELEEKFRKRRQLYKQKKTIQFPEKEPMQEDSEESVRQSESINKEDQAD